MYRAFIRHRASRALLGVVGLSLASLIVACSQEAGSRGPSVETPKGPLEADAGNGQEGTASPSDSLEPIPTDEAAGLTSCDGVNKVTVSEDLTGQELANALMAQWKRDHPGHDWVAEEKRAHAFEPPADNSDLLQGDQRKGDIYGDYSKDDLLIWSREAEKFVAEGSRIFHDAEALGSPIGVSCDMCHPHAANTHPETYPKFQVQLGRVALLRDMIDWCIENPVRGKHLDSDGAKMRALEAYIMAQRKGVEMEYGKH